MFFVIPLCSLCSKTALNMLHSGISNQFWSTKNTKETLRTQKETIMIYRSKAPLRIGLAGGGTDVSPYCDLYGGAILNATISLYAHAAIEPLQENKVIFDSADRKEQQTCDATFPLPLDGKLDILKGVINRVAKDY